MNLDEAMEALAACRIKRPGIVYISDLVKVAKMIGKDHDLAVGLWQTAQPSARELAVRVADPELANEAFLDSWLQDLNDWDITDGFTGHFVRHTKFAEKMAFKWVHRQPEFERRAGFALLAQMAWSKNDFKDDVFIQFLPMIRTYASDERFYVKKAVNWALRDIGKRNDALKPHAQAMADELQASDNKTARWIGKHRMKEIA